MQNRIKKFGLLVCSAVLLVLTGVASYEKSLIQLPAPNSGYRDFGAEFGLRFYGGYGFLFGENTFNDFSLSRSESQQEMVNYYNSMGASLSLNGEFVPLEHMFSGGGEIFFNFVPFIGLGFGAGYLIGDLDGGTIKFRDNVSLISMEDKYFQKITSLYLRMTLYGGIPFGNVLRLIPYFGGGYYKGTVSYEYDSTLKDPMGGYESIEDITWAAKSNGLGFHGGLNIEIYLARHFGLFVGASGLLVAFQDLIGELDWYEWNNIWGGDSGTEYNIKLWKGDTETVPFGTYRWMWLSEEEPFGWGVSNVQPGVISISQFKIEVGFTIFFVR